MIRKIDLPTIPGRIFVGRPFGAKVQIATEEELLKACETIGRAYEKSDPDATIWPLHVIILRVDTRWCEHLVQVDIAQREADQTPAALLADEAAQVIERLRGCNQDHMLKGEHDAQPAKAANPKRKNTRAAKPKAKRRR